jgi:Fic-DOC domain mobile mystery protein B
MTSTKPLGTTEPSTDGLIPVASTAAEINEFEQANIARGMLWAEKSRKLKAELLTASGLKLLHEKLFGDTWKWAGDFRSIELSIGVHPSKIQQELGHLIGNVKYWIENKTFPPDEIAIRFHHKLVWIHLFRNGNGRHSREATNLLVQQLGGKKFPWGGKSLISDKGHRDLYISLLKTADQSEQYGELIKFARS